MKKISLSKYKLPCGALVFSMLASSMASAQDAPAGGADAEEDIFELSPFTVNSADDEGWRATNTLAGSRLNSSLKDTPAVLDVLTSELLEDLGITDLADALSLSANYEENIGDLGDAGTVINSSFPGASQNLNFRTRGQNAALARNFIPTGFRPEHYTTERIDNSSGPNAILFGIGGAGGIANVTTKRASYSKDKLSVSFRGDENGSFSVSTDANVVVVEDKVGFRINAIRSSNSSFRDFSDSDLRGVHAALKIKLSDRTELNIELESDRTEALVVDPRPIRTFFNVWDDLGRPLVTTATSAATGTSSYGNNNYLSWIDDGDQSFIANFRQAGRSLGTADSFQLDETVVPLSVNLSGPGGRKEVNRNLAALSIDHRLGEKLYLNFSASREYGNSFSHQTFFNGTGNGNTLLLGDPNQILRNGVAGNPNEIAFETVGTQVQNPNAGELYVEGRWQRRTEANSRNYALLSLAWTLETERFGRHNVVSSLGYGETAGDTVNFDFVWSDRAFNNTPNNANNRVFLRNYVTPGDFGDYYVPDWESVIGQTIPHPRPTTPGVGETVTPIWEPNTFRSSNVENVNGLIAVQSFLLNNRLVTTLGLRRDEQDSNDLGQVTVTENIGTEAAPINVNRGLALGTVPNFRKTGGNSRSLGVVYHITDEVSVYANTSNSFAAGNASRFGPDGLRGPQEDGEGRDIGLKFNFAENKYSLDIGYFETSTVNASANLGINSGADDAFKGVWDDIFETLNAPVNGTQVLNTLDPAAIATLRGSFSELVPIFTAQRDTLDRDSSGYEVRFNATPVKGMKIRATYAYSINENSNILGNTTLATSQLNSYIGSLGPNVLSLQGGQLNATIGQYLTFLDNIVAETIETNTGSFGTPRHRINFNGTYGLQGRLKGVTLGAGYQYRSATRIGSYNLSDDEGVLTASVPVFGESTSDWDLTINYRTKMKLFGRDTRTTFLLKADNVFQSSPEVIVRRVDAIDVVEGAPLPDLGPATHAVIRNPRTLSASVKFDF